MKYCNLTTMILLIAVFFQLGNSQWQYKQELTIPSVGSDLSDYQVAIDLDANNFNYSHANSDGSDLRFSTDSTGTADDISYWIESWNTNGVSNVWVNLPTLQAEQDQKIYMFYGNTSAAPVGDGEATFDFFDDFNGTELDTTKWKIIREFGTIELVDGSLRMHRPANAQVNQIESIATLSGYKVIEYRQYLVEWNYYYSSVSYGDSIQASSIGYSLYPSYESALFTGNSVSPPRCGTSASEEGDIISNPYVSAWFTEKFIISDTVLSRSFNDGPIETATRYTGLSSGKIGMLGSSAAGFSMESLTDYLFVRKFNSIEPSVTFGGEESGEFPLNIAGHEPTVPTAIELDQNYPNPFNPTTVISLQLPVSSHLELAVYDVAGRKVRELMDGVAGTGTHQYTWDGTNDAGQQVSSGVYFYKLVADGFSQTKKMVLMR